MTVPQHVLILGAGLAGPCLALSLARHSIPSTLIELRPCLSESGGSISLTANALKVLDKYAGVYDHILSTGYAYNNFGAYTEDGEKLGQIQSGLGEQGGYPAVRIMRTALNRLLVEKAVELGTEVKWGMKLERIEETEDGVTAVFEDGEKIKGDILIGADGIRSVARKHILGPLSPTPKYDGICVVNGFHLPTSTAVLPDPSFQFPAFLFTPTGIFMTIPIDASGETLAWGINMSTHDRTRSEWKEFEISGEAARQAKKEFDIIKFEPVRSLLDNADETKAKVWATYSLPDISTWHTKRVCLIGDAAHGLPPNGQGSAMAFEDAAILTRLLTTTANNVDYNAIFEKLEQARRPRLDKLRKSRAGRMIKGNAGWLWWLKKWAMRGYFWWNGGVVKHAEEYDVDQVDLGM